jgi:proteasome accessory factor A
VAIPKVCGIETEYGISVRGADVNPVVSSTLLINSYLGRNQQFIGWDFQDEHPGTDARGFSLDDILDPEIEMHLVNRVLTNGARYYVDHAHPELATPECRTADEVVLYDRAADEIVRLSMKSANDFLPDGAELIIYKNNSDGKGNSYGCHENYLVSRSTPFGRLVGEITPHFVTRQIFCGAGKVGCESVSMNNSDIPFQISQRADFFEEEVGLETTLKRPIVNTRDEPHCDPTKYRRLHVIVGDSNMSEIATFLKIGTTAIVLSMVEDGVLNHLPFLSHPVPAIRQVSHDPTLKATILLSNGKRATALDIQWSLFEAAQKYAMTHDLESVGDKTGERVLVEWEQVLNGLDHDIDSVASVVDWVAKQRIVTGFAQRHSLSSGDARLKAIDLQYHDLRIEKSLASRAGLRTMIETRSALLAMTDPPDSTRAYFRGTCLQRWPESIVAANWDSLVFDVGLDSLVRVPMMEPLRGTRELTENLFIECSTPAELISRLGGVAQPL